MTAHDLLILAIGAALSIAGGLAMYALGRRDSRADRCTCQPPSRDLLPGMLRSRRAPRGYRPGRAPVRHPQPRPAWDQPTRPLRLVDRIAADQRHVRAEDR